MKLTLSWLKEHLDTTDSLDTITETLTRIGLEVEGVEDKAKALSAFTIAYVIEAKQHPNADRLRVAAPPERKFAGAHEHALAHPHSGDLGPECVYDTGHLVSRNCG